MPVKTLHIIRNIDDKLAQEMIHHDSAKGSVSVLLIQDGVLSRLHGVGDIYASVYDVEARGLNTSYKLVDYSSICQLIIDHEKVIVW
ncbi:MAG: hypothetical protein A2132_04055 [Nitrospirae bacterium RBG_16_43_11]|nr:MAG: hypothetical protein A2132_04055 [Nitrospirae bacterium RBG_16_43_11]